MASARCERCEPATGPPTAHLTPAAPQVTGKLGKCIAPTVVSQKPTTLKVSSGSVVDKETDAVLFSCKAKTGLAKLTITCTGPNDEVLCVALGKDGLTSAGARFLRSTPAYKGQGPAVEKAPDGGELYSFATLEIKKSFFGATATYSYTKGDPDGDSVMVPLYVATKVKAMQFLVRVENMDGTLVAKYWQPGMNPKVCECMCGKGVDMLAVCLLGSFVGAATGSGGAAVGGLAGAGVI